MVGVERHELDEADLVGGVPGEPRERQHLLLGEAAHRDGVDLDRVRLGEARQPLEPAQHLSERVAAGQLVEPVALQRVDRDVEAADAGADERLGVSLEQKAVRRDRQVLRRRRSRRASRPAPGSSRRTSGSPPVRRTSWTPIAASSATIRAISSKLRISARSSHGSPSAGMQYWQRKLQRSVTDTRRSPICGRDRPPRARVTSTTGYPSRRCG